MEDNIIDDNSLSDENNDTEKKEDIWKHVKAGKKRKKLKD